MVQRVLASVQAAARAADLAVRAAVQAASGRMAAAVAVRQTRLPWEAAAEVPCRALAAQPMSRVLRGSEAAAEAQAAPCRAVPEEVAASGLAAAVVRAAWCARAAAVVHRGPSWSSAHLEAAGAAVHRRRLEEAAAAQVDGQRPLEAAGAIQARAAHQ